jgi:glycosyltransferase involved in cell wall biosynthesis
MNILIVVSDLGLGGAQKVVISLANGLIGKHNIYLYDLFPEKRRPELYAEISERVKVIEYKPTFLARVGLKLLYAILRITPRSKGYARKLTYLEKKQFISKFSRKNKLDIINTHMWWADKFIVDTFGNNLPCTLVISPHGDHIHFSNDNDVANFQRDLRKVFDRAAYILYLSDNYLELISRLNLANGPALRKVTNGFNLCKPIAGKQNITEKVPFTFLIASRARADKGWKEAIECILLLQKAGYSDCRLVLAGDGELLDELKTNYPPEQYPFIHFLGFISDILSYIELSDIILLPTYHAEQLPTIIIEALFMGKPVISTDVGEIRNMLTYDNQMAGRIVPLVNGKPQRKELYRVMLEMMTNEEQRKRYSELAFRAYEKFNYASFIDEYERVFRMAK